MRIFLLPLAFFFRIIVFFRNILYDYGYIKTVQSNARVISVGNINSGGTGKTPLVEYITRYLLQKNKSVVLITKGYKSEIDDMQVVELGYKNEDHKLTSENLGDESIMLLENFMEDKSRKGLLLVSENKRSGAKLADSKFKPDFIVIDDGFQRRDILRDLDIVVLSIPIKGHLIPAGNFREPFSSTKRADIKILNFKFEDTQEYNYSKLGELPRAKYELKGFFNIKNERLQERNINAVAFCGLGDPKSFKMLLEMEKINVFEFIHFPDHHNYKTDDVEKIINTFKLSKGNAILTTQKDFVRFKYSNELYADQNNPVKELVNNSPFYFAKIQLKFIQNEDILLSKINELIKE